MRRVDLGEASAGFMAPIKAKATARAKDIMTVGAMTFVCSGLEMNYSSNISSTSRVDESLEDGYFYVVFPAFQ